MRRHIDVAGFLVGYFDVLLVGVEYLSIILHFATVIYGRRLTRTTGKLHLTLEHRSAAATDPMEVRLVDLAPGGGEAHLEVAGAGGNEPPRSLRDDILAALAGGGGPVQRADLRARLRVANHKLGDVLLALEKEGRVIRSGDGWALARNS